MEKGYEDIAILITREWNGHKLGLTKLQNAYANATMEILSNKTKEKQNITKYIQETKGKGSKQ